MSDNLGNQHTATEDQIELLSSINLGGIVAEHDLLLEYARVETTTLRELFGDKVDLVPGTKGSGKTALFRVVSEFMQPLLLKTGTVLITGVESTGDPVFQAFKNRFETISEKEFETFWRIYFVALLLEGFVNAPTHEGFFHACRAELEEFREKCKLYRIPACEKRNSFISIVRGVLSRVRVGLGSASFDADGSQKYQILEVEPSDSGDGSASVEPDYPVYFSDLHSCMLQLLEKSNAKVWIMLDRLDEVFERRTALERKALRSLLRVSRSFHTERMRIKLFIRDDVLEHVVSGNDGFTAMTHIEARKSATLKWEAPELVMLLAKRFLHNTRVRKHLGMTREQLDSKGSSYAAVVFDAVFPSQVNPGKRQSKTLDWMIKHCEDGRGVVTPRDILFLVETAIKEQIKLLRRGLAASATLLSAQALREAFKELSRAKVRNYLMAEFPQFWDIIKKFEGGKADYDLKGLCTLLGEGAKPSFDDLVAVGFLRSSRATGRYVVPVLFRAGLDIKQGRAR